MKRILTTMTLIGLASQLNAMTPTELIRQMQGEVRGDRAPAQRHVRSHTERSAHRVVHHRTARKVHKVNQKMERQLAHTTPQRRRFRTLNEFQNLEHRQAIHARHRARSVGRRVQAHHRIPVNGLHRSNRYVGNGWYEDEHGQYDEQYTDSTPAPVWHPRVRHHRQHAFRHYRRQWYLTYLYERAEFYDRHGYHYGYFNERGFVFEGVFYRYDRAYTYQDRLHGKDLFAHRFYRPRHRYASHRFDWDSGNGAGFYFTWSL